MLQNLNSMIRLDIHITTLKRIFDMIELFKKIYKFMVLRWARTSPRRYIAFLQKKGIKIGANCHFYQGISSIWIDITRPSLVDIGENVAFNKNFQLYTHDFASKVFLHKFHTFIPSSGRVKIGNNVSFGADCTVLKGTTIGDNCFIGLGSIVSNNIPANSVAMGRPAKVVCTIDTFFEKRKKKCIQEALDYAKSIKERFNRQPRLKEFYEEFPLFLNGNDECPELPVKKQMGPAYEHFKSNHKAVFQGFEDFLKRAGI